MGVELALLTRVAFRGREIAGTRLGGLLALLAEDLRGGCGTARLIEGLWPDQRPEHPTRALQVLVSRARAQLGSDAIVSTPAGYRLTLSPDRVDAAAVLTRASSATRGLRLGDATDALAQADAGLTLWDAAPNGLPASADDPLSELRAARTATYRALVRVRALALCRLDRRGEVGEILNELMGEHPRDEEVLAQLLLAEAASLGPSAALTRYDAYRRELREELGSDPGAELRRIHRRLLEAEKPAVRRGVPHAPNALLGRDGDIAAVHELLGTSRVVSIIGPGGLGKTRTAHAVAGGARYRVVHLVSLAGVTADTDVVGEVASTLGVGDRGPVPTGGRVVSTDPIEGIAAALGPGRALLVLDNCEHVLDGVGGLVRDLVARGENLRVLTTSRSPLGLSSESVYMLPELSLATSVELFRQRANAARPGVELPEDAVRALCGRLDGLPLAVELAAARVRVMSVVEITRRLDDRFSLLRGAARDAPRRHRTLHAVIDWSWNLLAPDGRAAMRSLSVFPGGFTADTARRILGRTDGSEAAVWDILEQLVDQSLLQAADAGSGTRFRMLETVREFGAARRREAAEEDRVIGGLLGWAAEFGLAHHEALFGPDLVTSAARTRDEQENLLLALRLGIERGHDGSVAAACAVLGALWMFEADFGRLAALSGQSAHALSHLRPEPEFVEVARTALVLAAVSALIIQSPAAARALAGLRRLPRPAAPDSAARATALVLASLAAARREDVFAALTRLCDSDQPLLAGIANTVATFVWQSANEPGRALDAARRTLACFDGQDRLEFPWFLVVTHSRIGQLCLDLGLGEEAHEHFAATLSILDALPGLNAFEGGSSAARVRCAMVMADLQRGAVDEAEYWLDLTLRLDGDEGGPLPAFTTASRAEILLARGEIEAGLRLWRQAAGAVRERRDRAGDEPFQRAWALEVQAMTVIAHARHGRLALIGQLAGDLPPAAAGLIGEHVAGSSASYPDFPVFGTLLLALAVLDLDRGRRTGDARAAASGARMIALAERLRYARGYQPTMSAAELRGLALRADGPAYAEAVSAYAGLGADELRAAAAAAAARAQVTGPSPAGTARPPRGIRAR